jgi:hypothetical protein
VPQPLINISHRQPGDLGVLRGAIHSFSEEARTRGFASLVLASYAFVSAIVRLERESVERKANDFDFRQTINMLRVKMANPAIDVIGKMRRLIEITLGFSAWLMSNMKNQPSAILGRKQSFTMISGEWLLTARIGH